VCGGTLKPHVVFFGENVPRPRVDEAFALLDAADVVLVVGSSLTVFSGFRFVRRAHTNGQPVAIVNLGPTRGDALAAVQVEGPTGLVLPALADALPSVSDGAPRATATSSPFG
jgi:NAD-dependent SIR2 family protein deacetylase